MINKSKIDEISEHTQDITNKQDAKANILKRRGNFSGHYFLSQVCTLVMRVSKPIEGEMCESFCDGCNQKSSIGLTQNQKARHHRAVAGTEYSLKTLRSGNI